MQAISAYIRPDNYPLKFKASFQVNDYVEDNKDNNYLIILMEVIVHGR
jgi:hypothetical protein